MRTMVRRILQGALVFALANALGEAILRVFGSSLTDAATSLLLRARALAWASWWTWATQGRVLACIAAVMMFALAVVLVAQIRRGPPLSTAIVLVNLPGAAVLCAVAVCVAPVVGIAWLAAKCAVWGWARLRDRWDAVVVYR